MKTAWATLFLLLFSAAADAQRLEAYLTTEVQTSIGKVYVRGEAHIDQYELPNTAHPKSMVIPKVVIAVDELSASIFGVMGMLRKQDFFDAYDYPQILVTNVVVDTSRRAEGTVTIKGISKKESGYWEIDRVSKNLKVRFAISLNDFSISHRALMFNIHDRADVTVEMENPFVAR